MPDLTLPAEVAAFDDAVSAVGSGSWTTSSAIIGGVVSSSAAIVSAGTGGSASWIASLSDATIKADMIAAASGGTVTESGLVKLFSDLVANLTTGNTTLSASQYNDLKLIATNLNVGETASPYLIYVTNALVLGNTANALWTGGKASAVTLGNLNAGATAIQLAELEGKWLLGTDLPMSVVQSSGSGAFNISYSAVTAPLFGAAGPVMDDVNQGRLGDCYLLSALAEVACENPSLIKSMIVDNGNNSYGVRFFSGGNAEWVTVNNYLANGGTIFNHATNIWADLIEKAYAQAEAIGLLTGYGRYNYGNSFSTIGNGGLPRYALEAITGASTITDFNASGSSWSQYNYNSSLSMQSYGYGLSTKSVLATLVAALAMGNDLLLTSRTNAVDSAGKTTLVSNHVLSIYGYNAVTDNLMIRNPWGAVTSVNQRWNPTFEVSLTTLLAAGDTITVDNMAGKASSVVNNAPVSAAAGLQANAAVTSFSTKDSGANVGTALGNLAAYGKLTGIMLTDTTPPSFALTAAQLSADIAVLGKITSAYTLSVSGATAASAASLQANSHVTGLTVADTAAAINSQVATLKGLSKILSITATGSTGADTLNLTGISKSCTIALNGDTASASVGLAQPSLSFIGTPDAITLGSGATTIQFTLAASSGIETIAKFQYGLDHLDINLNGAANSVLKAFDTKVNNVHAISVYSSADPTHGVVLLGMSTSQTAANLLSSHTSFSGGHAIIF